MLCKVCVITVGHPRHSAHPYHFFSKRTSLTREDNVFDYETAELQKVSVHNKHQQNLRNLLANTSQLPEGWEIVDFKTTPTAEKRSTIGSVPLTDEDNYTEWTGVIGIGTPAARAAAQRAATYPSIPLVTLRPALGDIAFTDTYGDGSTMSGHAYTDTVNVGGVVVTGAAVGAASDISGMFTDGLASGLLGLAYPSLCPFATFFSRAISQHAVPAGISGLRMATPQSEITIGDTDSSQYTGPIEYHPVDTSTGYWTLTDASVLVNSGTVVSSVTTIIDSGTELIYGPPDQVAALFASVPGALSGGNGYYVYPCATPPTIGFSWGSGGQTWTISPDVLGIGAGYVNGEPDWCVAVIIGLDVGFSPKTWMVGDRFLQDVYAAFSFDDNAVGFAALATPVVVN